MKPREELLPNFVVIESQVLIDNRINSNEKLLYSYICLLTNNKRLSCFANNKYLARIFNVSERQIQNYLKNLKKYNYICITVENGNKRKINTIINTFLSSREKINDEIEKMQIDFEYDWLDNKNSD